MRFRRRLILLYAVFAIGLAVVWLRTIQMQTVDGDYWAERAQRARQMTRILEAPRGPIVDANGVVLARDEATLQLVVVPWEYERRHRVRCSACGLYTFLKSEKRRLPRRCRCQSAARARELASLHSAHAPGAKQTLSRLPPGDLRPLERALGMEPGTLDRRARERLRKVALVVKRFVDLMEARGELEFFRKDHEDSLAADLKRRPFVLETGIPDEAARLILLDESGQYRGFRIQTDLRRRYPRGDLAPRLLGYASKVRDEAEYQQLRGQHGTGTVTRNTRVGRSGCERAFNWHLHGRPGWQRLARDHNGSFTVVADHKPPVPGTRLRLSLHADASERAEEILRRYATREAYFPEARPSAGFVMLDAETGEILLWSELPNYDTNTDLDELYDPRLTRATYDAAEGAWIPQAGLPPGMDLAMWRERVDAPAPLALSRVSQIAVEPGSTFKALIGLGLLHTGHLQPHWEHTCFAGEGYKPGCHACGAVDLELALIKSCNRYFAWFMRDSKRTAWGDRRRVIGAFMQRFGLGMPPSPFYSEWSKGKWGDDAIDFTVSDVLRTLRKELVDAHRQDAKAAHERGEAPPPAPPRIALSFAGGCPDRLAGNPRTLRRLLSEVIERVARTTACETVRVRAALHRKTERRYDLRFEVRAAGAPRWTTLPGAALEDLPAAWRRAMREERLGIHGNPARGGSIWFHVRYEHPTGRSSRADSPQIHPHDGRNVGIGQGPVLVTPLQMARAMAALANGGVLVTPHAVTEIGGHVHREERRALEVSATHLNAVRRGMLGVVEHARGTAHNKGFENVAATVYGKTGTAQLGGDWKYFKPAEPGEDEAWHHWFVGFAEAPGRRTVAFACVLHARREQAAGVTAARATAEILEQWFGR